MVFHYEVCVKAHPFPRVPGYPAVVEATLARRLRARAISGWLVGGLLGSLPMWVEAVQRFAHRLEGGVGESALWGEPTLYAVLRLLLPSEWTAGGALVFVLLGILAPRARRRKGSENVRR